MSTCTSRDRKLAKTGHFLSDMHVLAGIASRTENRKG